RVVRVVLRCDLAAEESALGVHSIDDRLVLTLLLVGTGNADQRVAPRHVEQDHGHRNRRVGHALVGAAGGAGRPGLTGGAHGAAAGEDALERGPLPEPQLELLERRHSPSPLPDTDASSRTRTWRVRGGRFFREPLPKTAPAAPERAIAVSSVPR